MSSPVLWLRWSISFILFCVVVRVSGFWRPFICIIGFCSSLCSECELDVVCESECEGVCGSECVMAEWEAQWLLVVVM